jgi:hypothetical protein
VHSLTSSRAMTSGATRQLQENLLISALEIALASGECLKWSKHPVPGRGREGLESALPRRWLIRPEASGIHPSEPFAFNGEIDRSRPVPDAAVQLAVLQDRGYDCPMSKSLDDYTGFEEHLQRKGGKCRAFNVSDVYERRQKSSAYFRNKASDMHAGAVVVWHAYQTPVGLEPDREAQRLGLEPGREVPGRKAWPLGLGMPPDPDPLIWKFPGFRLDAALPPVFTLLAGLSIELQIKAVARLLDLENRNIHRIADLSEQIGIALSSDHAWLAASLTEYIYWASRYPTPGDEAEFYKGRDIITHAGKINLARYESLWTVYHSAYWRAKKVISEP